MQRKWLIRWMYLVAIGHVLGGLLLAWLPHLPFLDSYHQSVLHGFWQTQVPEHASAFHMWWLSLFGATLQNIGLLMGVLIYAGDKLRARWIWGWIIIGLVLWAPQDIIISLQANIFLHLWADVIALATMLPPLLILFFSDVSSDNRL